MAAKNTDWTTLREYQPDGQAYGYVHGPSGLRLIDIRKHPVTGYDPSCGKWNVFEPGNVFPINAGSGTVAEWKAWIEREAAKRASQEA